MSEFEVPSPWPDGVTVSDALRDSCRPWRPLRIRDVRRVHVHVEEDGRRSLVFRGRQWRLFAIGERRLDDDRRVRAATLLDQLSASADVDPAARRLVGGGPS